MLLEKTNMNIFFFSQTKFRKFSERMYIKEQNIRKMFRIMDRSWLFGWGCGNAQCFEIDAEIFFRI